MKTINLLMARNSIFILVSKLLYFTNPLSTLKKRIDTWKCRVKWILYRKLSIQWIWINARYVTVWMEMLVNEKWMKQLLWRLVWTENKHFWNMNWYLIIYRTGDLGKDYWMGKVIFISDLVVWDSGMMRGWKMLIVWFNIYHE